MSKLHAATAWGWVWASLLRVLTAANLSTAFGEERNSWSTVGQLGPAPDDTPFRVVLTSNRSDEVGGSNILHVTNSSGSLDIDHVGFMPQQSLEEFVHLSLDTGH